LLQSESVVKLRQHRWLQCHDQRRRQQQQLPCDKATAVTLLQLLLLLPVMAVASAAVDGYSSGCGVLTRKLAFGGFVCISNHWLPTELPQQQRC
jgi:hypothetical protein